MAAFVSAAALAFVTALLGIGSYWYQKITERKIELRNRRMQAYESYLTAYRKDILLYDQDPPPANDSEEVVEAEAAYWLAYSSLFQIASDPVIIAVADFHQCAWIEDPTASPESIEQFKVLYADMIKKMRVDVSEKTELSEDQIKAHLPFNFGFYFQGNKSAQSNGPE
jgi:hypothetical protein